MSERGQYEEYYELEAAGVHIGVMTCKRCGAAVILDKAASGPKLHDAWHESVKPVREGSET